MIKSTKFWFAIVLLALIPLLLIDIAEHYLSWQKEVREQLIDTVQNVYNYNKAQKAEILDNVFERNTTLGLLIAVKTLLSLVFLITGIYLLRLYAKSDKPGFFKPALMGVSLAAIFLAVKFVWVLTVNTAPGAKFLTIKEGDSFEAIVQKNLPGKVVYADFWGTTCGSCLAEFGNFTHPLKAKYKTRPGIAYLYISRGNQYLWKQQIKKYNIDGYHIFLSDNEYDNLYRNALKNDTAFIFMPRYLITDKSGKVQVNNAKRPSDQGQLFAQIDKYLK